MRIRGLGSAFGAEVRGLSWGVPAPEVVHQLTIALRRHLLLVMRGMASPTHDQLDDFFRPFGRLLLETRDGTFHYGKFTGNDQEVVHRKSDGNYVVSTDMGAAELGWHNDQFHKPQLKILSVLEAVEFEPGSTPTCFRDMYTAYEMLPAELRAALEYKQSINFDPKLPGPDELPRLCDAMHPIFTAHPHSGRRALYICDFTAAYRRDGSGAKRSAHEGAAPACRRQRAAVRPSMGGGRHRGLGQCRRAASARRDTAAPAPPLARVRRRGGMMEPLFRQ